jgi:hypothetical protein
VKTAQVVLDFVRVLVWPGVVVLALLRFRRSIGAVMERFNKATVKGPAGTEVTLEAYEAVTRDLQDRIDEPVQALTAPGRPRQTDGWNGIDDLEDRRAAASDPDEADEAARRRAVERLLTDAATWGWELARLGIEQSPHVRVTWGPDGRPRLSPGPLSPDR